MAEKYDIFKETQKMNDMLKQCHAGEAGSLEKIMDDIEARQRGDNLHGALMALEKKSKTQVETELTHALHNRMNFKAFGQKRFEDEPLQTEMEIVTLAKLLHMYPHVSARSLENMFREYQATDIWRIYW